MPKMYGNSHQIASYVNPSTRKRIERLRKKFPLWSISRIGGECIERALPELERELERRTSLNGTVVA